jgi:hypothetical protein
MGVAFGKRLFELSLKATHAMRNSNGYFDANKPVMVL